MCSCTVLENTLVMYRTRADADAHTDAHAALSEAVASGAWIRRGTGARRPGQAQRVVALHNVQPVVLRPLPHGAAAIRAAKGDVQLRLGNQSATTSPGVRSKRPSMRSFLKVLGVGVFGTLALWMLVLEPFASWPNIIPDFKVKSTPAGANVVVDVDSLPRRPPRPPSAPTPPLLPMPPSLPPHEPAMAVLRKRSCAPHVLGAIVRSRIDNRRCEDGGEGSVSSVCALGCAARL